MFFQASLAASDYGLMFSKSVTASEWKDRFCVLYNPGFQELPDTREKASVHKIVDISTKDGCKADDFTSDVNNSVVVVARGNCYFVTKALLAQHAGAKAVIIASNELVLPSINSTHDYNEINITVATAEHADVRQYLDGKMDLMAMLYRPNMDAKFDPNMVVIFLIAVSNIIFGGFWAGVNKQAVFKKQKYRHKRERPTGDITHTNLDSDSESEDQESVDVSIIVILVFVVIACGFLVLLYFFYDYLVYVVIALFCIATASGLYSCLCPLVHRIVPWGGRLPVNKIPILRGRPQYRDMILLAFCCGLSIFWGIQRHAPYAWIIQDILGYAFCLNVMKIVGMPNLKICTVMLSLLFIYDIFFVFITPLFTSGGESIMVKVATGSSSKTNEKLPMVFQVPRLTQDALSACPLPYSLLGFGDIIIPGLLVTHNHYFDLRVNSRRVYYIVTCIGYAVGLIITFIALALMETGQPALLYLVPCTLLPTYFVGCIRGEVKQLWSGQTKNEETAPKESAPSDVDNDNLNVVITESAGAPNTPNSTVAIPRSNSASSSENEAKTLLRK